jgi:hypothetical protein
MRMTKGAIALLMSISFLGVTWSTRAQGTKKSPLHGLVTMGALSPLLVKGGHADNSLKEANIHPGVYSGVVLLASWDELEHVEGVLDTSRIDAGLAAVRAYNKKYPDTPVKAKLRLFSGWNTPLWVIAKSGGSITLSDKHGPVAIGRFWTPEYRQAWSKLQSMLAAKYDDDPLLEEVAVSSCATITAEPFIMPLTPANLPALHAAGFSDAGYKACLMGALDDYSHWRNTAIDYTVNPFRDSDSGQAQPDDAFTVTVMEAFRKRYGSRGVLANHGLQPQVSSRQVNIAEAFRKLGPPIEFQTISPVMDWDACVALGLKYRATEIEVWNTRDAGGPANVTYDQLKKWSAEMKAMPSTETANH